MIKLQQSSQSLVNIPTMATKEEVREKLNEENIAFTETTTSTGQTTFKTETPKATINVWANGTCNVQGKAEVKGHLESVLDGLVGKQDGLGNVVKQSQPQGSKKVFVVYGHDETSKAQLTNMLRKWGLEPLVLDDLPSNGSTIIEKLEEYQQDIGWGIVLLTPDDLGRAKDANTDASRPRQNVVLEMGMLLGKLGRKRTTMLYKKSDPDMELPSDVQGYVYIPFRDNVESIAKSLAQEMASQGFYEVPVSKL